MRPAARCGLPAAISTIESIRKIAGAGGRAGERTRREEAAQHLALRILGTSPTHPPQPCQDPLQGHHQVPPLTPLGTPLMPPPPHPFPLHAAL